MNPVEYDDILEMIEKIPKEWYKDYKKISFKIITYRKDASWVSSRIFEEVDRNLISAEIKAKSSRYSIELDILMTVIAGLAAKKAVDILLEELRDYLRRKWINKQRQKN